MASVISAVVLSIVVARALGPTDRGVYVLAVLTGTLAALFGDFGMSTAGIVFGSNRLFSMGRVHWVAIALSLVMAAVGTVLLVALEPFWTSWVLSGLDKRFLLLVGLCIGPLIYARIVGATLTGAGHVQAVARIRIAISLLAFALTAPFVVLTHSPLAGVAAWFAVNAVFAGMLGLAMVKHDERPSRPSLRVFGDLISFGLRAHVGTLAHHGFLRVDVFFVSAQLGPKSVGLYSLASVTAERIALLGQAAYSASASRMGSDAPAEAARLTAQIVRALVLILIPASVLLAAVATPLMTVIYGSAFAPAALPFQLLLPGTVCLTLWALLGLYVVSALRRPGTTTLIQGAALLVAVPLYFVAVRWQGMVGAAVVSSGVYIGVCAAGATTLIRTSTVGPRDLVPRLSDLRAAGALARRALTGRGRGGS
jgi:O-antigen/teichoic acid export membrane protein